MEALKNALPGAESEELSEQEILAHLTDEERARFLALTDTFESDGWRIIKEHAIARGLAAGVNGANAGGMDGTEVAVVSARNFGARQVWGEVETMAESWYNTFENAARERIDAENESEELDDLTAE